MSKNAIKIVKALHSRGFTAVAVEYVPNTGWEFASREGYGFLGNGFHKALATAYTKEAFEKPLEHPLLKKGFELERPKYPPADYLF